MTKTKKTDDLERLEAGGDAWEASEPITEPLVVKRPLDKVLPVRLNDQQWRQVREEANELGIGPSTLLRMWTVEKLRQGHRTVSHATKR